MKSILEKSYKKFQNSGIYCFLREIKILRKLIKEIQKRFFPSTPLHGDLILHKIFKMLSKELKPTCIVETGTYLGLGSTLFFAKNNPDLKIYTCEINKKYYLEAKKNLRKFKNVYLYHKDSRKFLKFLIEKNVLGERPLIFLDSHWENDFPLGEEVKIISEKIASCVILIDDFKIPKDSRFRFDDYGEMKQPSLEIIVPNINKKKRYHLLFPNYGPKEAFKEGVSHHKLTGYPVIFQNTNQLFEKLKSTNFINKYFTDKSFLLKK